MPFELLVDRTSNTVFMCLINENFVEINKRNNFLIWYEITRTNYN